MLPSKDANFVGYTYKNLEIVNEDHIPGVGAYQPSNSLVMMLKYIVFSSPTVYGQKKKKKKKKKKGRGVGNMDHTINSVMKTDIVK
jgi:hypothetical protein